MVLIAVVASATSSEVLDLAANLIFVSVTVILMTILKTQPLVDKAW